AFIGPLEDGTFEIEDIAHSPSREQMSQTRGTESHRAIENCPGRGSLRHCPRNLLWRLQIHRTAQVTDCRLLRTSRIQYEKRCAIMHLHPFRQNLSADLWNTRVSLPRDALNPFQIVPINPEKHRGNHCKHLWNRSEVHRRKAWLGV